MSTDPVHEHEGQWYFWDEVWAYRVGPYKSEEEARKQLNHYSEYLDNIRRGKNE